MENYANYGLEAELKVVQYLNENTGFNITHFHPKKNPKEYGYNYDSYSTSNYGFNNVKKNKIRNPVAFSRTINGDIEIDSNKFTIRANVVRGTWVSNNNVDKFKGQVYIMYPDGDISDISKGHVITNSMLKKYHRTCIEKNRKPEFIAKKSGFRYKNFKGFLTLDEFVVLLNKLAIMGYEQFEKEFYIYFSKPFKNKYKRHIGVKS